MAAKDLFHESVKKALLKDQWMITAEPLRLKFEGIRLAIDLAAEKILAAQKGNQRIAVEIKSFLNDSALIDFHLALGQFLNYKLALQMSEPARTLYLAIPLEAFESFFQEKFIQESIQQYELKLLVYNPEQEQIERWIN
ncbi:MAG: XisH family protein [Cyanobacteria bacterium J06592_8]